MNRRMDHTRTHRQMISNEVGHLASQFVFFLLFRSRLDVVMKPRESIDYAVECVILLLWGGVIVDWIFSAAPISFSQASRFPVLTFQYQFSYLEATESSCYKKKCKLIKKIEALRRMVHFSPGRDQ